MGKIEHRKGAEKTDVTVKREIVGGRMNTSKRAGETLYRRYRVENGQAGFR